MNNDPIGHILAGDRDILASGRDTWSKQPVDWVLTDGDYPPVPGVQRTLAHPVTLTGPGTFFGKAIRSITLEPTELQGWWFDRTDLPESLATKVSIRNVWTTGEVVSNIVLRSGSPHNYARMVEHLIALKVGLGLDNVMLRLESGDPPLFERGSLDLVEAIENAGYAETEDKARYVTVKEKVTVGSPFGGFLTLVPCRGDKPELNIDCAIDFPTAIGQQRIQFPLTAQHFRHGSEARTNTSAAKMFYCRTIGKVFANIRNLGYTDKNVLVAGHKGYVNEPRLYHEGKSLEAVWHRATLDLLAALALIEKGRFVGDIISYKAGHRLDVQMMTLLYLNDLLEDFQP
jgi:UDP-3-O-acyl-N-acetylglucosamine deacetylase